MAAVIYGGSPRHQSRMLITPNGTISSGMQNYHKHSHSSSIPPLPLQTSIPSNHNHTTYHHQHHQSQISYSTYTTTIAQTKIYAHPNSYSTVAQPLSPQKPPQLPQKQHTAQQYHSLPASISIQQQLPPQLPQKTRQRYHPGNLSGNCLSIDSTSGCHTRLSKRRSAVELLAESKPYYVKSELVLDRQQHLNHRTDGGRNIPATPSSSESTNMPYLPSPSHTFPHQRPQTLSNRRSVTANSELLQTKLRRLLNDSTVTKEQHTSNIENNKNTGKYYQRSNDDIENSKYNKQLPKYLSPQRLNQELTIHSISDQNSDNLMIYPSAFLSPQSLPPQHFLSDDDLPSYDYCDNDDSLILTNDYQTISPPAEYAESSSPPFIDTQQRRDSSANRYQRSNSHSQAIDKDEPDYLSTANNKNSHKSLPDLHTQTNRHSPHSDAMSYRSRGNRSNKSGSSMNRDSGGSSGHYTHRSEPYCCQQQPQTIYQDANVQQAPVINMDYRRDSGSSTQHSNNSYRNDCIECNLKNQCGDNCLLNFTTSEVPEAFQDDYVGNKSVQYSTRHRSRLTYCGESGRRSLPSSPDEIQNERRGSGENEISPPLGTFRRQRCLRFKQHPNRYSSSSERTRGDGAYDDDERKPILRSKSDISHRYSHRNVQSHDTNNTGKCNMPNSPPNNLLNAKKLSKSENLLQLERFFDHLGLNDDKYDEYIGFSRRDSNSDSNHSSPVFFSDVSTVDSNRLLDSTETQTAIQPYRPIETTSIVERNARIIKWLCNCRKLQMT